MSMARETKEAITVPDDTKDTETNRVNEKIIMEEDATKVWRNTYGSSFILGSSTHGILGTSKLGESARVVTLHSVVNPNNVFREHFRDNTFEDTGETTADWGDTEGELSIVDGEIAQSTSIAFNDGNISRATMNVALSSGSIGNLLLKISADGGSTWDVISNGVESILSSSGTDLRVYLENTGGGGWPTPWDTWGTPSSGDTCVITDLIVAYG